MEKIHANADAAGEAAYSKVMQTNPDSGPRIVAIALRAAVASASARALSSSRRLQQTAMWGLSTAVIERHVSLYQVKHSIA